MRMFALALHVADFVLIVAVIAAGFAATYLLLLRKLKQPSAALELKVAKQFSLLDDAIRRLETRLAGYATAPSTADASAITPEAIEGEIAVNVAESDDVAPEIKAAIAAAAVATLGQNTQVLSIKPSTRATANPWTQQGRVLVQGSHNLRVRR